MSPSTIIVILLAATVCVATSSTDIDVKIGEEYISIDRNILYERAPGFRSGLVYGDSYIEISNGYCYYDVVFAIECIKNNDIPVNADITYSRILVLQEFGNDDLLRKAISLYTPTINDIKLYTCHSLAKEHRHSCQRKFAKILNLLMNNRFAERSIVFDTTVDILKFAFPDKESLIPEAILYIKIECITYINRILDDNSHIYFNATYVYLMKLLLL